MYTRVPPGTLIDEGGVQMRAEGAYGSMFSIPRIDTALKVSQDEHTVSKLSAEFGVYRMLNRPGTAWRSSIISCPAPITLFRTVLSAEEELNITVPLLSKAEKESCCAFSMDLISPMPKVLWDRISGAKTRLHSLAHLKLDRAEITNDDEDELGEPVAVGYKTAQEEFGIDVKAVATELGRLVAHFHFVIRYDLDDVEIVLGASKHSPKKVGVYLVDLSNVKRFVCPKDSARVLMNLEGYIPRPGSELYPDFISGYERYATAVQESNLAVEVVRKFQ